MGTIELAVSMSCTCGKVLFKGREAVQPYYIRAKHNCRCPNCGRKLSHTPMSVQLGLFKN